MAVVEETTHLTLTHIILLGIPFDFAGQTLNHWTAAWIGSNLYPYITFPLLTIAGELGYRLWTREGSGD